MAKDLPRSPDVDANLAAHPQEVRARLAEIRERVHAAAEGTAAGAVGERISYGLPTVTVGGRILVHFGGWAEHVAIYPPPPGTPAEVARYEPFIAGKGTLRFPMTDPMPWDVVDLVARLHVARAEEAERDRRR